MKSVIAAIAALAATVVSAQTVVTSQPGQGQVLTAGTTAKIVWTPISGNITNIDLRKGAASALAFVGTIATDIDGSAGSYSWAIDASLAAGTDYALSFGQSPNVSYSPFFTIQAAAGGAAPAAPATSSKAAAGTTAAAATTKAAASSSAAASPAATTTSAGNKNVAAVGVAAVAGAVVAALI